jgi:PIN domain nuclease of toxin-antitoxin system
MNVLLDTHVLLWWLDDHPSLSEKARANIANGENLIFVSGAVIWEIRIKQALGKLEIPPDFCDVLDKEAFEMLSITAEHAHAVGELPGYHRDPFDRMLVAQARVEGFTIITRDIIFERYHIPIIKT